VLTIYHYEAPCVGENLRLGYRVKKNDSEPQFMIKQNGLIMNGDLTKSQAQKKGTKAILFQTSLLFHAN
jgi:hypothetical protein